MLDNPNLSLEKMLEVLAQGKDIVGISFALVIVILVYIYRYEISLFIKYGFSKDNKDVSSLGISQLLKTNFSDLEKKDFDNKVDNLLDKFNNPSMDGEDSQIIDNIMSASSNSEIIPPIFRSLKTIKTSNEILYHFVNDGGTIHNIEIIPIDEITLSIEPTANLESKGSGYIKFRFANNSTKNKLSFDLSYYDELDNLKKVECIYSFSSDKISITEIEKN